jgi:hypothetical protein
MVKKANQLLKPFKILLFLFFYSLDFELIKNNIQYLKKGFNNYILDNNIKVINNSDNNLTNII